MTGFYTVEETVARTHTLHIGVLSLDFLYLFVYANNCSSAAEMLWK